MRLDSNAPPGKEMHEYLSRPRVNWLFLPLFVVLCTIFVFSRMDSLFIGSIDLAHHVVLVTRLMEHFGGGLAASDPATGLMAIYPRYAHALAAAVGLLVNSPVLGVHVVSLVALLVIWSAWALAARSLPGAVGALTCAWLFVLLVVGDRFIRLEVFGGEIIVNFFYAQIVGQALACVAIAAATLLDARRAPACIGYALLAGAAWLLTEVHLLPALQVLGFLVLMVLTDLMAAGRRSLPDQAFGVAAILTSFALIVFGSQFRFMVKNAEFDGGLNLRYTSEPWQVVVLAVVIAVVAGGAIAAWLARPERERRTLAYWRAVAIFALAASGLTIAQYAALKLGYGSPYSVKKHGFALNSSIVLLLSLMLASIAPRFRAPFAWLTPLGSTSRWATACLIPLAFLGLRSFEPRHAMIETSRLVDAERFARTMQMLVIGDPAPKRDYAIGVSGIGTIGDYLVSVASLHSAIDDNAAAIYRGDRLPHGEKARYFLTSTDQRFWATPACRRTPPALGLVFVDASCVLAEIVPSCQGTLDVASGGSLSPYAFEGLSSAEDSGRWSDGAEASFTCRVRNGSPKPHLIKFATAAFLPPGRQTQRLVVAMIGVEPTTFLYDAATPARNIALPVPEAALASGTLHVTFRFPDAVSPRAAGLSADPRQLAIVFKTVSFDVETQTPAH